MKKSESKPRLYTTDALAKACGVHRITVVHHMRLGRVPPPDTMVATYMVWFPDTAAKVIQWFSKRRREGTFGPGRPRKEKK